MDGTIATVIMVAAALAMLALPVVGMALASASRSNRRLAERNAAQAATIGVLERRLAERVPAERIAPPGGPWSERRPRVAQPDYAAIGIDDPEGRN